MSPIFFWLPWDPICNDMCSSASVNGVGMGLSPWGGKTSVKTIVLMLDDPDSNMVSKQGVQQNQFAGLGQLLLYNPEAMMQKKWSSQCNEENTSYTTELKFESWEAATTKHYIPAVIQYLYNLIKGSAHQMIWIFFYKFKV